MNCTPNQKTLCGGVDCTTCMERSFATHERSANWSDSNELRPNQVLRYSNKKYKFDCQDCGHEIELACNNVIKGQWCGYCNSDKLCSSECQFCYQKSFASHPMAEYWSARNDVTPRQIMRRSDKKMWFDCHECGHSFDMHLYRIMNDSHCIYCSNQKLCDAEDCKVCFDKSCASHEMAQSWSPLNNINPRMVFLQTNKKYIFHCNTCDHDYETTPNHYYRRNGACSYCANQKLCDADCKTCFQKSFASHPRMNCWSKSNTINPRMTFKGSEKRAIFRCDECHSEFDTMLYNILTGYWCPYCKKKTEKLVMQFLKENYECKTQVRFDWCRWSETNNIMPFDFGVDNVMIELDGRQHFGQVAKWDKHEKTQQKDIEKIKRCIENGKSVIHLLQEDVWHNRYDWKGLLRKEIEMLRESGTPRCIFITNSDSYRTHMEQLGDIEFNVKFPTS